MSYQVDGCTGPSAGARFALRAEEREREDEERMAWLNAYCEKQKKARSPEERANLLRMKKKREDDWNSRRQARRAAARRKP